MKIKLSPTRTWLADTVAKRRSNFKILLLFITAFFIFSCGNPFLDEILNEGKGSSGKDIWLGYTSIEEAMAWLKTQPTGDNATYPITLPLNIFLGDMTAEEGSNWDLLLIALAETGKYVNLDLSECYMVSPYIFDPGENSEGKNLIVTIVYPKQAKTIIPWNSSGKKYTSITDAMAWLRDQSAGDGVANPVTLALKIQLGAMPSDQWDALLNALAQLDPPKYINLDLSECSMATPYEFNPDSYYSGGNNYIVSLVLPKQAQSIADGIPSYSTFYGFNNLTQISGANIKTIGNSAFENCTSLTSVNLPLATSIGDNAFNYCTALTSVSLPKAESIGYSAFYDCPSLTSVDLPKATTIGQYSFLGCTSLTTVSLPAATTIESRAFSNCTALTSVNLPNATSVDEGLFVSCTSLTTISMPKATIVGDEAFMYCDNLREVDLPAVETFFGGSFANCYSLQFLNIPSIRSISQGLFVNTGIQSLIITMGTTPPTLGIEIFYGITSNKPVTVKVPVGATGYSPADIIPFSVSGTDSNVNWGNGFRGMGWTGSAFDGGTLNTYIMLTIESY